MKFVNLLKTRINWISFLILCPFLTIWGQRDLNFEHISLNKGLSQSSVFSVMQDYNGFLWIGTLDGLNRFDGYNFEVYRSTDNKSNSIAGNTIFSIIQSKDSLIWIGTSQGLSRFNHKNESFENYFHIKNNNNSLSSNNIRIIHEDIDGTLWIGTNFGLNHFNPKTKQITQYIFAEYPLNINSIWDIFQEKPNELWVATSWGVYLFDTEMKKIIKHILLPPSKEETEDYYVKNVNVVRSVYKESQTLLWIGTNGSGLYQYNLNTNKFIQITKTHKDNLSIAKDRIRKIYKDNEGNLWFGSYSGIGVFWGLQREHFQIYSTVYENPKSINSNKIVTIAQDNLNQLWIGTLGGGLNKTALIPPKFSLYQVIPYQKNSLNTNMILSIIQDKSGNIWLGTDKGINVLSKDRKTYKHLLHEEFNPNSLSDNVVYALIEDSSGMIWAGTAEGYLNKYNKKENRFTRFPLIKADYQNQIHYGITKIAEDRYPLLWVGAHNGLFCFDRKTFKTKHYQHNPSDKNSLSSNVIYHIAIDNKQRVWIGTEGGGLNMLNTQTNQIKHYLHNPLDSNTISDNTVRFVLKENDNILWIATNNGLNKFDISKESFTTFNQKNGLANNFIYSIIKDGTNLWLSTNQGISKLDLYNLRFTNYSTTDGLQGFEFNQNAYFKNEQSGEMFFGGINGFNSFFAKDVNPNMQKPLVHITGLYINNNRVDNNIPNIFLNESILHTKELNLKHNQNFFSFIFTAIHLDKPEYNKYKYKLEGFDQDWIAAGNRRYTTYTNVPPGTYVFKVAASNADDVWSDQNAEIRINISPPFYQTIWFYLLMIVLIITTILIYIRYRTYRLTKEKLVLQRKVFERTIEIENQAEEIRNQRDELLKIYEELKIRSHEISQQKNLLEQKNLKLLDSINYAQRIQKAILPSRDYISSLFPQNFVLYMPKDIVSGDFYWISEKNDKILFAAVDCTGHGVPGALMSIISYDILNQATNEHGLTEPSQILEYIQIQLNKTLLTDEHTSVKEGMDIALCTYDKKLRVLEYSGAINPLYIIRNHQLLEFKADYTPIVVSQKIEHTDIKFKSNQIPIEKGDIVYIYTDGYTDQFGGTNKKKFLRKNLKELLLNIHTHPLLLQKQLLRESFNKWKGDYEQIDDVLIFAVKFNFNE